MPDPLLLAILFGVVRNLKRKPITRRRDQQAEGEAVATSLGVLALAVTPIFLGALFSVARAVSVLRLLARLAAQCGIDDTVRHR